MNDSDKSKVDETRTCICRGNLEFCQALCAYLKKELTFADVADFRVNIWTPHYSFDVEPYLGETHEVSADAGSCKQYTTSVQRARDCARDFAAGWKAAGKK